MVYRKATPMPNAFWYLLICLISILIMGYTLFKFRDRRLVSLYLFMAGLTYSIEYVILVLLNAYKYSPKLLANGYFDNILGAVVSDAFLVPMVATMVGAFQFSQVWIAVTVCGCVVIEYFFLEFNLYEHYWWTLTYTAILFFVGFNLAKKLADTLRKSLTNLVRFIILYFTSVFVLATFVFVLCALFNAYVYQIGWFKNPTRDHVAFATVFILILSLVLVPLAILRVHWMWKLLTIISTLVVDYTFLRLGILHVTAHWSLGYFLVIRMIVVFILLFSDRVLLKDNE